MERIYLNNISLSSFHQTPDEVTTNTTWMIIAILSTAVAILLAISSITMGAVLWRKSVKTMLQLKSTTHKQGIHIQVHK